MKYKKLFIVLFIITFANLFAQNIRPIRDEVGFCWNANEMDRFVKFLSQYENKSLSEEQNAVAAISPHDDYLYAGSIYFPLFTKIKTKEVVIFGVTHGTVRKEMDNPHDLIILDEYNYWKGPYGNVGISPLRELIKFGMTENYLMISNKAQSIEHSIEALIPFLQYYNREIKITPIMVTQMSFGRMEELSGRLSQIIIEYMRANNLEPGKDIFFLISNDANHYGKDFDNSPYGEDANAHQAGIENDQRIIKEYLNGEIDTTKLKSLAEEILPGSIKTKQQPLWCGRYPIIFGLMTTGNVIKQINGKTLAGQLIKYSDTFTEKVLPFKESSMGLTAPFSLKHWVGFFSAQFYIE